MPVFSLDPNLIFPHPILRDPDGLLAVGGDLSPQRLLLAYSWGIYPWYHEEHPILWWWTAPRLLLKPDAVHISHSMRSFLQKHPYTITINTRFRETVERCGQQPRKDQDGTWILPEMADAYETLHQMGYAHSIEVSEGDNLIGGLYGVAIGKIFCGESMFASKPNTSKLALITLCQWLQEQGFEWIDCQQDTPHLRSMGAVLVEEKEYLSILRKNQKNIFANGQNIF